MSWTHLTTPLTVLLVGIALIVALFVAPHGRSGTGSPDQNAARQEETPTDVPCDQYPKPQEDTPSRCGPTPTSAYPDPEQTSGPSPTAETPSPTSQTATTPATTPNTPDTSATIPSVTSEAAPISSPTTDTVTAESTVSAIETTEETTPTPTNELTCTPGEPLTIDGSGPPRAPILLYFDQRVVGGGSVAPSGSFSLPLLVGKERPGVYVVTVRIRGTMEVLRELSCAVPAATPATAVTAPF